MCNRITLREDLVDERYRGWNWSYDKAFWRNDLKKNCRTFAINIHSPKRHNDLWHVFIKVVFHYFVSKESIHVVGFPNSFPTAPVRPLSLRLRETTQDMCSQARIPAWQHLGSASPAMQNANMEIFILHPLMDVYFISLHIFSISSFDAIKIGRGSSVGQKLVTFACFFLHLDMVCVQLTTSCDCAHPELWMNGSTSCSFA